VLPPVVAKSRRLEEIGVLSAAIIVPLVKKYFFELGCV
jgi:hypothetical protein